MAEPFKNRDDIKAWLDTQPRDVISVFAARAALRSLPRLAKHLPSKTYRDSLPNLSQACFWATSISLSSSSMSYHSEALKTLTATTVSGYTANDAVDAAAFSAADTASGMPPNSTTYAYTMTLDRDDVNANAAAFAAAAIAGAFSADEDVSTFAAAFDAVYAEYHKDRNFIDSGKPPSELAIAPLWSDRSTASYKTLSKDWLDLKLYLIGHSKAWWVWTQWYEDRLRGNADEPFKLPFVEEVEIGEDFENGQHGRCTLPEEFYKDSIKANAAIAEIIEGYWARQKNSQDSQDNDVSDDIEDIVDATPLGEDLTLRDNGTFDVEFLPVHDLFAKNLKRIEDAISQALKANAFNEDSQEIKFLREILHSHADDPQRIHDDCGFVHSAITDLIIKEIISDGFAVKRLLNAIDQTQLHIRAYEPTVRKAYEAVSELSVNETVDIDNEELKTSAEQVEHTQSERLKSEIGPDFSILFGGERGAAAYRLLSRFSRMYQLIKNSAHNHVLTDAASLSLMQAMPFIGNIIQYLRQVFGL